MHMSSAGQRRRLRWIIPIMLLLLLLLATVALAGAALDGDGANGATTPPATLTPRPIQGGVIRATATALATSTPPSGNVTIPATIEAEDYRPGGPGVGYVDTSEGNRGGAYRDDDVDIQPCSDPTSGDDCYSVGWIRSGEWLAYDLMLPDAGNYLITIRAASWNHDTALHLEVGGRDISAAVIVPDSGDPQGFTDIPIGPFHFPAGPLTLKVVSRSDGWNFNFLRVERGADEVVLAGAGDIADCNLPGAELTATLLDAISGVVFTTGDHAYPDGTHEEFATCYDPTWGRHRERTRPSVGNHEYETPEGAGYFDYFGPLVGHPEGGYYSYDYGAWHVITLNSNCSRGGPAAGCDDGDPQVEWLKADLAANDNVCTVAYWHHPRWSSGEYGDDENMAVFWDLLYEAGVDLVINGHEHFYERYAPLAPDGSPDDVGGIRQITVGTGGGEFEAEPTTPTRAELRQAGIWGVLRLTLKMDGYDWEFIPVAGASFTDTGSGTCHE